MLTGWDDRALLEEVLACPRGAFVPMPGLRVVERPGWHQLVAPWLKDGGLNGVSLSVLDAGEADAVIDATIAEYRALGVRFRWSVPPFGAVVSQQARGRGLYRALVGARLRHAAAHGIGVATTQALEHTSAPLLAHMGFVPVCRFSVYHG